MNCVTLESSLIEIDELLRKYRGKIIFRQNGIDLNIDTGKYKTNYASRIFSFCHNKIILENTKKFFILFSKLNSTQYSEINCLLSELNAKGANINLTDPIRISSKSKKCQIRIGCLPVFMVNDENSDLKYKCNFEKPKIKSDSIHFKPQFLLQYNEKLKFEIIDYDKNLNFSDFKYIYCGHSKDGSIFSIISEGILKTITNNKENFTNDEFLALKEFCCNLEEIKKMVIQKEKHNFLKLSYQNLLNCSLRSNEIHKNFGELYAAINYSLCFNNREILLPFSGSMYFFDFVSIEKKKNKRYVFVKKIPIKAKPNGATSSFTALLSCLYFNENHILFNDIKMIIENCPRSHLIISKLKNTKRFDELTLAILNFYRTIDFECNSNNLYELIKPIFKDLEIARKFWKYILPAIDIEKTKEKIEIGLVDIDGSVNFIQFNPLTVSICRPKKPKENVTALLTNKREKQ